MKSSLQIIAKFLSVLLISFSLQSCKESQSKVTQEANDMLSAKNFATNIEKQYNQGHEEIKWGLSLEEVKQILQKNEIDFDYSKTKYTESLTYNEGDVTVRLYVRRNRFYSFSHTTSFKDPDNKDQKFWSKELGQNLKELNFENAKITAYPNVSTGWSNVGGARKNTSVSVSFTVTHKATLQLAVAEEQNEKSLKESVRENKISNLKNLLLTPKG